MRESDVLAFNPWGDDDSDYRVLDNRMVVTRYRHLCSVCFESIPPGDRVRAQREVWDGRAKTFYFCRACCRAFGHVHRTGRIEVVESRYSIGQTNARALDAQRFDAVVAACGHGGGA